MEEEALEKDNSGELQSLVPCSPPHYLVTHTLPSSSFNAGSERKRNSSGGGLVAGKKVAAA